MGEKRKKTQKKEHEPTHGPRNKEHAAETQHTGHRATLGEHRGHTGNTPGAHRGTPLEHRGDNGGTPGAQQGTVGAH